MPTNLQALVRLKVIDRCIKDKSTKYTFDSLLEQVNKELSEYNSKPITVSERTIYDDLKFLKDDKYGFNAPIHRTNELGYHYTNDNFSIFNTEINRSDIDQIKDVIISLRELSNKEHFDGLNNALIKLEEVFNLSVPSNDQPTIFFENSLNEVGQKWITKIHEAIRLKKTLSIRYKAFDKPESHHYLCPYFIKEYNNRWFIFGWKLKPPGKKGFVGLTHLGLDRIIDCNKSLLDFHQEEIDYRKQVEDVIGVSVRSKQIKKIKFKVSGIRRHYVLTKPLHRNQKTLELTESFGLFEISVIPNPEMYSRLLSFGQDLKVMSPKSIKDEMKNYIHQMMALYQ